MWRLFITWCQAHMLWHMASRPDADPAPEPPRPLDVGDMVRKTRGYEYIGVIVSKFQTTTGVTRVVVEHMTIVGMLHIFNEEQLERLNGEINNGGNH